MALAVTMERFCPDCDTNLTEMANDQKNFVSYPGKWFAGVFCTGCGKVVMPIAKPIA